MEKQGDFLEMDGKMISAGLYYNLIFVESLRIVLKESFMEDPLRICRVTCHRTSELLASRQMSSQ